MFSPLNSSQKTATDLPRQVAMLFDRWAALVDENPQEKVHAGLVQHLQKAGFLEVHPRESFPHVRVYCWHRSASLAAATRPRCIGAQHEVAATATCM